MVRRSVGCPNLPTGGNVNRTSLGLAAACLVSGALGAFGVSILSTPAEARGNAVRGSPFIVGTSATTDVDPSFSNCHTAGLLFRTWSDGTVDVLAYSISWPPCSATLICAGNPPPDPPCYLSFGIVPEHPPLLGDLTVDGVVDGADLGILLGQWSDKPAAR